MWRATWVKTGVTIEGLISIHALRVESDASQSTTDTWKEISIHALRVESDESVAVIDDIDIVFQSTLSVWRATELWGSSKDDD